GMADSELVTILERVGKSIGQAQQTGNFLMSRKSAARRTVSETETGSDDCACDENLPTIAEMGYSPFQHLVLVVCRGVCRGYLTEDVSEWDEVYTISEQHLGLVDGPLLASACISLLRGVRGDRRGTFNFRPIGCKHVSVDEMRLMRVVNAFQARPDGQHRTVVAELVCNPQPFRTVLAARALANFAHEKAAASPMIFQTPDAPHLLN
ncbi:MAG: hypothetical protein AAFZ01_12345, partial [Pseudomonadota bacterium]